MTITFDLYAPDYVSGGDPIFVQTLERSDSNALHALHYLVGFTAENGDYIIKNLKVYP